MKGLWRGIGPNVARNAIVNAAELASYDQVSVPFPLYVFSCRAHSRQHCAAIIQYIPQVCVIAFVLFDCLHQACHFQAKKPFDLLTTVEHFEFLFLPGWQLVSNNALVQQWLSEK